MPRPPGRRACPTGSARTRAPLPSSAGSRRWWCPTICARASPRPASTSRRSTAPTPRWRPTTTPPLCRRGRIGPRDKAKVEVAVQVATRFIIAKLRNRQFFSLSALNAAIAELVAQINNRVSRHLGASRRALFEDLERSALKPLPAEPYVFAEWKECRVGLDYHVEIEQALLLGAAPVAAREGLGAHHGAHDRGLPPRQARCRACALVLQPQAHDGARAHAVEPPALCRLDAGAPRRQAGEIGRHTSALVEIILRERTHPEQGFRACVGILRLAKTLWPRTARSRLQPGARDRRALLQLRQLDPEEQPRSPTACNARGRAGDSARQHPRPHLLPLRR